MCQTVCQTTTEFQTWEQFSPDLKVLTENWKFRYIFNIYVPIYESVDLSMYWPIWLNCLGSFRLTTKLRIRYKNVPYILCSHMVQSLSHYQHPQAEQLTCYWTYMDCPHSPHFASKLTLGWVLVWTNVLLLSCAVTSDSSWPHGLQQALQASLSLTISRSFSKFRSIALVMPSNHLIFWCPLLLLPSIFLSIKDFSNESVIHIRWPKYWGFSFSISSSNEYSGLISFNIDWFDLLAVQGTLRSLL